MSNKLLPDWAGIAKGMIAGNPAIDALREQQSFMKQQATQAQYQHEMEKLCDDMEELAHSTIYTGQSVPGSAYSGWPLGHLLDTVPAGHRSAVRQIFMQRHARQMLAPSGPPQAQRRVYTFQEKMEMRMGWQPGEHQPFVFVEYRSVQDTAFMWILTLDAKSVVLEDEAALFPSDALITKVRLLGGNNG